MAQNIDPKVYLNMIGDEVNLVVNTLRDKGGKKFGRAFVVAGFLVFAAYAGVYMPPQQKSAKLQSQIDKAKVLADFGDRYKDLRGQLNTAYTGLPAVTEREQWLSNSVRDSLSVAGLVTEDFKPVREQEMSGLIFQASGVSLTLKFSEFYDWILRIESAKPMLYVTSIEVSKKKDQTGYNGAVAEVATVIPKKRFQ